jgi:hypothetical protein
VNRFLDRLSALAVALVIASTAIPATAADLPEPTGEVILTVSDRAGDTVARFDRAMLEALPQTTVATSTDWTDGQPVFTGPLARDVLAAAGVSGTIVDAGALNDYHVTFPAADFADWDVILAMTMDGTPLSVRDKGPIWIVYPRDDNPGLANPEVNSRWVWQLQSLTLD